MVRRVVSHPDFIAFRKRFQSATTMPSSLREDKCGVSEADGTVSTVNKALRAGCGNSPTPPSPNGCASVRRSRASSRSASPSRSTPSYRVQRQGNRWGSTARDTRQSPNMNAGRWQGQMARAGGGGGGTELPPELCRQVKKPAGCPIAACSAKRPSLYTDRRSRSVAQPGSAPRSGRGGRRFKSCHSDQLFPEMFQQSTAQPPATAGVVSTKIQTEIGSVGLMQGSRL